jgi:CheY-like chemotaxis protein
MSHRRRINILLAEDNKHDAELVQEAFSDLEVNHSIQVVADGESALTMLRHRTPDVLFLDLNLPKLSGLGVLRKMRKTPTLAHVPVIILTNSTSDDDVYSAYRGGVNAYIRKPLGFDNLLRVVKSTVGFWFGVAVIPGFPTPQFNGPDTER